MNGDEKSAGDVICSCCRRALPRNGNVLRRSVPLLKTPISASAMPVVPGLDANGWRQLLTDEVNAFVDARLSLAAALLAGEDLRIFRSMTYVQQAVFVFSSVRAGDLR
jgi:hypothetical protein